MRSSTVNGQLKLYSGRLLGAALGLIVDRKFGEPLNRMHPVVLFGRHARQVENLTWSDQRASGLLAWLLILAPVMLLGRFSSDSLLQVALCSYVACAEKSLLEEAEAIRSYVALGDLDSARDRLISLVGRDRTGLDETEIIKAVIESVAENSVDAVVSPLLASAVFGVRGALLYRAVNTLDSMFGHWSPTYLHFGWTSARADDVANYIPARLSALLVSLLGPTKSTYASAKRDGAAHPSPNAGLVEASFANALSVQLGGRLSYGGHCEARPILAAHSIQPKESDISAAIQLVKRVDTCLICIMATLGTTLFVLSRRELGSTRGGR